MPKLAFVGYITVIQENRFRLTSDDGRSFVFTLSHKSALDPVAVRRLQRSGVPVQIEYHGVPNTASGIVVAIHSLCA